MKRILFLFLLFCEYSFAQNNSNDAINWLNKNVIPITSLKAETGFNDLTQINKIIGDVKIVFLGECTHGSSEIFTMKHRMLEYLVKEKGFTIFSIEANMPEAYALNEYILYGKGDPKKLIAGMYFWTWYTQEILDMVNWMKLYNETVTKKVMFTGFDMQYTEVASAIVRNYFVNRNNTILSLLNKYDSVIIMNSGKRLTRNLSANLKDYASIILDTLNALKHKKGDTSFSWAFQNATILWQRAASYKDNPSRDESMAKNIDWIVQQNPSQKIVVWAHNSHIRKVAGKFQRESMGQYLYKKYKKEMLVIGFSTNEGTYTAKQVSDTKYVIDSANNLIDAKGDSFENYFKQCNEENFFLDCRNIFKEEEGVKWLFEKKYARLIGAVAIDKYQFVQTKIVEDFDCLIFLRKTTSSKCFSIFKSGIVK